MDSNQRFISLIETNGKLKFHTCKLVMSSSSNSKHRNFDICDLEFVKIDCLLIVRSLAPHVSHAIHEEGYVERNAETKVEVHPEGCPDRF